MVVNDNECNLLEFESKIEVKVTALDYSHTLM